MERNCPIGQETGGRAGPLRAWHNRPMVSRPPSRTFPPPGVLLFLVYAFLVLALIGLSMKFVVDQAISAPVSPVGIVVMALLAFTIFTITLTLQRKEAARGMALTLRTLLVIPAVYSVLYFNWLVGVVLAVLFALLILGLRRPGSRAYFTEP